MEDAPEPRQDDAKARAAHYRARAFEVRKRAIEVDWAGLKRSFLQIAGFYDKLARQLDPAPNEKFARPADGTHSKTSENL